jgi:hypothetical protein
MKGSTDDNGLIQLDLKYDKVNFADIVNCEMGSGAGKETIAISDLKVTIPPGSRGVALTLNQTLSGSGDTISGKASVFVVPINGAQ